MLSRPIRLFGAGLILAVFLGCGTGNVAYKQGYRAELRKDWDTALVNYEKAVESEPENAHYKVHERQARTQASLLHLKRGRQLLAEGRQEEAAGEFQKAASIDPSNENAAQELARLLAAQAAAKQAREKVLREALASQQEAEQAAGVRLKPFPTEPVGRVRMTGEARKVFESVAKLADLNVAFTPDFMQLQTRPVSLDLTNVHAEEVLNILCIQTKTFWRPVTANTILVIPDTLNNHRDYDEEVLKTVYLSNALAAVDRTAITNAVKGVLGLTRVVENGDANAIVIRDTPARVAAAEKLIHELDRAKAEILVDVAVVEADRTRIRDLGLTPATITPTGTVTPGLQGAGVYTPPTSSSSSGSSSSTASVGSLGKVFLKDYSVVLPSAVANAVLSDSRTHILQNPEVRVTDGQTAKLRIGSQIPIATGSFLPSLGAVTGGTTGGIGLLASTTFQYKDIGVNLDITPHLMADGEVAIHAVIEISSLGPLISIAGFSQNSFSQRKIEHDIRLKEGEVNLLGGLIQTNIIRTVSGTPILGDIPLLHYLFSTEHRDREETEVLVMLTPRVIRLSEPLLAKGASVPTAPGGPVQGLVPEETPAQPGIPPPTQPQP